MQENKFKLTKQLKEDWIKALESGDYEQFGDKLRNPNNHKQCCCLGVLATIHPDINITDSGEDCLINGINKKYYPFEDMNIHKIEDVSKPELTVVNDNTYSIGFRDYSKVIPIIKDLPTVD